MRAIVLTAVVAGFVGLSAGVWLKSTVLASASPVDHALAATVSPSDLMHSAPRDLPVTVVQDPI